jgi:hypothetical protein
MLCKLIDEKLKTLKCKNRKKSEESEPNPFARSLSQPSSSPRPLSPFSPFSRNKIPKLQSPHKSLRPYYTSSPINPPTPVLIKYPISTQYSSRPPSLFPSTISFSQQTPHPLESSSTETESDPLSVSLKKSTTEQPSPPNYITNILEEDMDLSNQILLTMITDYNNYTNKITDADYFISRANAILLEYIEANEFRTDNIYQAYNFIILGSMVSFWIFYKFMIDDNTINTNYLNYYLTLNNVDLDIDTILNIEIDILKTIDYNILKFI